VKSQKTLKRLLHLNDSHYFKDERVVLILLLLLCLVPTFVFLNDTVMDPYFTSQLSATVISENNQAILDEPYPLAYSSLQKQVNGIADRVGLTTIILILAEVTGLSYGSLAFLPIGGVVIPLLLYTLCRRIFPSKKYGVAITIFVSFNALVFAPAYSINRHTWGYILLFTFLIIFLLILKSTKNQKKILYVLLFMVLITTILVYYATEFMLIVFMMTFLTLFLLEFKKIQTKKRIYLILAILIIPIIVLVFDPWGSPLIGYILTSFDHFFVNFVGGINMFFIGSESYPHQTYTESPFASLGLLSALFLIMVISLPTFLFLFRFLKKKLSILWQYIVIKSKIIEPTPTMDIILISLAIMAVSETLIYMFFDQVIFRSIWVIFPIVASVYVTRFSATKINGKKIIGIFLGILIIGAIVRFPISYSDMGFKDSSFALTDGGTLYYAKYAPIGSVVLTNQKTAGKLLVSSGIENKDIVTEMYFVKFRVADNISQNNVYFLYSETPDEAEQTFNEKDYEFLVLTKWDMYVGITDGNGRGLEPIGEYDDVLELSSHFILIYNDSNLLIYQHI